MSASDADSLRPGSVSFAGSQRKSLSQKFGSLLFGAKASHVSKFSIELDHDHKTYGPGETVSGAVILDVARPMGVTHVIVCLYGNVEVFKSHARPRRSPSENGRSSTGKGKRWVSEYYGDGFVSLFEEEVLLCGEGRLDPKLYHFRFNIDFPTKLGLPSSIEFERGSISYKVTVTITRPATIAPTMHCEREVLYREDINIATLPLPKPREATLQPISHEAPSKASLRRLTSTEGKSSAESKRSSAALAITQALRSGSNIKAATTTRDSIHSTRPPSPVAASSRSSSASHAAGSIVIVPPPARSSYSSPSRTDGSSRQLLTIHTSVELTRSGYLPGQLAYARINIKNHHKILQNPKGVIVTLYRQARVDMHPNLPLGSSSNRSRKYEDYYPRSKTGLGGLSLSAAGSSQVWRKDLSQTTSPLYINPVTMSAELKVGVRVPDEAFPSIRSVPGEMISFKYYIEVIIDIQGKLYLEEKMPSMLGLTAVAHAPDARQGNGLENQLQTMVFGPNCFDTTSIRRDKHAVVVQCDVVVGTRDYTSGKGKAPRVNQVELRADTDLQEEPVVDESTLLSFGVASPVADQTDGRPAWDSRYRNGWSEQDGEHGPDAWAAYPGYDSYYNYDENYAEGHDQEYYEGGEQDYGYLPPWQDQALSGSRLQPVLGLGSAVPLPPTVLDENLSEKERIRRHEASLLPSQPPMDDGLSDAAATSHATQPTAPILLDETDRYVVQSRQTASVERLSASQSRNNHDVENESKTGSGRMSHLVDNGGESPTSEAQGSRAVESTATTMTGNGLEPGNQSNAAQESSALSQNGYIVDSEAPIVVENLPAIGAEMAPDVAENDEAVLHSRAREPQSRYEALPRYEG